MQIVFRRFSELCLCVVLLLWAVACGRGTSPTGPSSSSPSAPVATAPSSQGLDTGWHVMTDVNGRNTPFSVRLLMVYPAVGSQVSVLAPGQSFPPFPTTPGTPTGGVCEYAPTYCFRPSYEVKMEVPNAGSFASHAYIQPYWSRDGVHTTMLTGNDGNLYAPLANQPKAIDNMTTLSVDATGLKPVQYIAPDSGFVMFTAIFGNGIPVTSVIQDWLTKSCPADYSSFTSRVPECMPRYIYNLGYHQ
jgi:hypothetical protein